MSLSFAEPFALSSHMVLRSGTPVGVLNPATVLARTSPEAGFEVIGPRGGVRVASESPPDTLAALVAAGSIVLGDAASAVAVDRYLRDEASSRTAAYLCSIVQDCGEIVRFFTALAAASVAVIGCGGIGSLAALILAGAGVGRLALFDPDVVEASNFNRQFVWSRADIGSYKVEVLQRWLLARHPELVVTTSTRALDRDTLPAALGSTDGVLFTADEPLGLVRDARRIAHARGIAFVVGGYVMADAVLSGSAHPRATQDTRTLTRIENGIAPSFGPTNAELAGACSALLMLRLGGLLGDEVVDVSWPVHRWPWAAPAESAEVDE